MGKNDFDIDFDFEKEYGFDPKTFLDADEYDENLDLSDFSDEELGLNEDAQTPPADPQDADFDLDDVDLDGDFDLDADLDLSSDGAEEDFPLEEELDEAAENVQDPQDFIDEDLDVFLNMPRHTQSEPAEEEEPQQPQWEESEQDVPADTVPDQPDLEPEQTEARPRRQRTPREPKPPREKTGPGIFTKFVDLYFGPLLNKQLREPVQDPTNPRHRRKKSPEQIFKEVYLPPLIACVCLILVLSFAIGALSNGIKKMRDDAERKDSQLASSQSAQQLAEQRKQQVLADAEALVQSYNYDAAIDLLDSLQMSEDTEVLAKRGDYVAAQSQLVEYKDFSLIPNLSFHVLIEDMSRAVADASLGGKYNQNFVSTSEFRKILEQLYNNNYVLVDYDSFIGAQKDPSGTTVFNTTSLWLPAGKKPVMITETMVNYYHYMVSDTDKGDPNAKGDGFANKLVLQNGEIKAEYINASGETLVGDYDLVPILEDFIRQHPDFSYQGARAILAVSGSEGIFGYRCITDYVATKGQDYVDKEIAGAKEIVQALRDKGYTLACYTYENKDYKQLSVQQIQTDLTNWTQKIVPIIGNVDVLVFAQASGITDYTGQAFTAITSAGFHYLVSKDSKPFTEVNTSYVRQNRLMVTGETMTWYSDQFTKDSLFDPNSVLDLSARVTTPAKAGK